MRGTSTSAARRSHRGAIGQPRRSAAQRQAQAATTSSVAQGGRSARCGPSATSSAARIQPSPLRGAHVGVDHQTGQAQAVGLAALVGIEHPAADLRQSRLRAERRQRLPVEDVRDDVGARVLLGEQTLAARIGLPRDAAQRVAGLERPQSREIVLALGVVLRAAGVGLDAGRRAATRGRRGPCDRVVLAVHDGPGAEQAERMTRRNRVTRERHAPAALCRQAQLDGGLTRRGHVRNARRRGTGDLDLRSRSHGPVLEQQPEDDLAAGERGLGAGEPQLEPEQVAVAVVHGDEADAREQEGEAEPEVVAEVEAAEDHREHHRRVADAECRGQDVDAPTVEAHRIRIEALPPPDPRLHACVEGRAKSAGRVSHRASGASQPRRRTRLRARGRLRARAGPPARRRGSATRRVARGGGRPPARAPPARPRGARLRGRA